MVGKRRATQKEAEADQAPQQKAARGAAAKAKTKAKALGKTFVEAKAAAKEGANNGEEDAAAKTMASLKAWEERLWGEGFPVVAGTDEAGRGPLAGPVVAGAFAVVGHRDPEVLSLLRKVGDSKAMLEADREEVYNQLTHPRFEGRLVWAVAEAPASEIDEMNILRASLAAMARAVRSLAVPPDCVLVDGCNRPPDLLRPGEQWTRGPKAAEQAKTDVKQKRLSSFFTLSRPAPAVTSPVENGASPEARWLPSRVEAVVGGDGLVLCISAASILAKVHRDRLMAELHKHYPLYGFDVHKGYPTPAHLEALRVHGVCPHHRKSFGPVRAAIGLPDGGATPERSGHCLREAFGLPPETQGNATRAAGTAEAAETPQPLRADVGPPLAEEGAGASEPERGTPEKLRARAAAADPGHKGRGEACELGRSRDLAAGFHT